ncbi:MAG: hypothetical protein AAGB19_02850 [Cyanobacteria bacterium P01_F01_bin.3]
MRNKTQVFKLDRLNKTNLQTIDQWLSALRWVWNEGLRLLEELETFTAAYKDDENKWHRAPCCPIPWQYRRIDKTQPWREGNLAPYTYFARKRPYAQFCRLVQDYRAPRLDSPHKYSLAKYFAHKRHSDKPWLKAVPANFIRGCTVALAKAWEKYKAGKAGKPRFRSAKDLNDTLINEDAKSIAISKLTDRDGLIRIPKLGRFRVKHLWADWDSDRQISVLKVAKRPDGYYLQLSGKFPDKKLRRTELTAKLEAPEKISSVLATIADTSKALKAYAPDQRLLNRKTRLLLQLARQQFGSSNWKKTKRKISRIEKRLAEQAKNYNQKLTTFLNRTYAHVDTGKVGKRKVLRKPSKRARAKTIDPIHYDPNGATAIAEYNQRITSQRTGQFVALIKQKNKARTIS